MHGPGRIAIFEQQPRMVRARLSNFDTGVATLKPQHQSWLREHAVHFLTAGGSLRIIGLASPSGDPGFNMALSRRRAEAVLAFLRREAARDFQVALAVPA